MSEISVLADVLGNWIIPPHLECQHMKSGQPVSLLETEHSSEDVVHCPEVGRCSVPLFGDGSWAVITQVAQDKTRILCDTGGGDDDSPEVNKPETDVMIVGRGPCSSGVPWSLACPV